MILSLPHRSPFGLDRLAIGMSGLCLVHCMATTVFIAFVASAGSFLGGPAFHEVGLGVAMMLGAVALGKGAYNHGFMLPVAIGGLGLGVMAGALKMDHGSGEAMVTMAGVLILALGHRLNVMAVD